MTENSNTHAGQPGASQTPDGTAAGSQNEPAASTEQIEIPASVLEKVKSKYGGDWTKAFDGLENAETRMHEATRQVKELRAEVDSIKTQAKPQPQPIAPVNDDERLRYETEFGMPYEQVVGNFKLIQNAMLPLMESNAELKVENFKAQVKSSDPDWTPDVEARFDTIVRAKHPNDRMIPQVLRSALKEAKSESFDDIVNARVAAKLKEINGGAAPASPQSLARPSSAAKPPAQQVLDDSQVKNIMAMTGMSEEQVKSMGGTNV